MRLSNRWKTLVNARQSNNVLASPELKVDTLIRALSPPSVTLPRPLFYGSSFLLLVFSDSGQSRCFFFVTLATQSLLLRKSVLDTLG